MEPAITFKDEESNNRIELCLDLKEEDMFVIPSFFLQQDNAYVYLRSVINDQITDLFGFQFSPEKINEISITVEDKKIKLYFKGALLWEGHLSETIHITNIIYSKSMDKLLSLDSALLLPQAATPQEIKQWYNSNAPFFDPESVVAGGNVELTSEGLRMEHDGKLTVDIESETGTAFFAGHVVGAVYND